MGKISYYFDKSLINSKNLKPIPKCYSHRSLQYSIADFLINKKISNQTHKKIIQQIGLLTKELNDDDLPNMLNKIANYFEVGIVVWKQKAPNNQIYVSMSTEKKALDLELLHLNDQYREIKNLQVLSSSYKCPKCEKYYTKLHKTHACYQQIENNEVKAVNSPKIYKPKQFLNEQLIDLGESIDPNYRWIKYYSVFDIEAFITPMEEDASFNAEQTVLEIQNAALIVFSSNIPGYEYQSFWRTSPAADFIGEFVKYCLEASEHASKLHFEMHKKIISDCLASANEALTNDKLFICRRYVKTIKKIFSHLSQLNIFGFNSKSYDINLLTAPQTQGSLFYHLISRDGNAMVLRDPGNSRYLLVASNNLRFVDISRFIPPTSLSKALENFEIKEKSLEDLYNDNELTAEKVFLGGGKLLMPYGVATSYEKIELENRAFTIEDFFNQLTKTSLLSPNWARYQELIKSVSSESALSIMNIKAMPADPEHVLKMINSIKERLNLNIRQYYELYAKTDCYCQLKLTTKIIDEYYHLGISWIFESLTLSSCSFNQLMRSIKPKGPGPAFFTLADDESMELLAKGKMGGVANAYQRLFVKGLTKIDYHRYGDKAETANYCALWDLNQLYTSSLSLMPLVCLGYPILRKKSENFKISKILGNSPKEMQFVYYLMENDFRRLTIQSAFTADGQKRLFLKDLGTYHPLDAYVKELKYGLNHHGCYWHSHSCLVSDDQLDQMHPSIGIPHRQVREKTEKIDLLLSKHPSLKEYYSFYECEFDRMLKAKPPLYVDPFNKSIQRNRNKEYTEHELVDQIINGEIHGFLECDLEINPQFYDHYLKMPIIFQKKKITLDQLDPVQREYAMRHHLIGPGEERDTLFCGMRGTQQVITTEMFKYFKDKNIVFITNINRMLQYHSDMIFEDWGLKMFEKRRRFIDQGKSISASFIKNLCNAAYGVSILNPLKRPKCKIISSNNNNAVLHRIESRNRLHFIRDVGFLDEPEKIQEVTYFPHQVRINTPQVLGVNILLNSKLVLIDFHFRMLITYFLPSHYCLGAQDTDSFQLIFAREKLSENVRPELRAEFESRIHEFIVPDKSHPDHAKLSNKPFLCKIEIDNGIIAINLCAKCYFILSAYKEYHQANKGINLKIIGNADKVDCMSKLNCLLETNYEPLRDACSRILKMSKNKYSMELVHQWKRSLNRLNIKARYCDGATCFVPADLTQDEIQKYFPFLKQKCPHSRDQCMEQILKLSKNYSCDFIDYFLLK